MKAVAAQKSAPKIFFNEVKSFSDDLCSTVFSVRWTNQTIGHHFRFFHSNICDPTRVPQIALCHTSPLRLTRHSSLIADVLGIFNSARHDSCRHLLSQHHQERRGRITSTRQFTRHVPLRRTVTWRSRCTT